MTFLLSIQSFRKLCVNENIKKKHLRTMKKIGERPIQKYPANQFCDDLQYKLFPLLNCSSSNSGNILVISSTLTDEYNKLLDRHLPFDNTTRSIKQIKQIILFPYIDKNEVDLGDLLVISSSLVDEYTKNIRHHLSIDNTANRKIKRLIEDINSSVIIERAISVNNVNNTVININKKINVLNCYIAYSTNQIALIVINRLMQNYTKQISILLEYTILPREMVKHIIGFMGFYPSVIDCLMANIDVLPVLKYNL
jgi:hypothetical protein